jgi:DNA (cytosine-5)-methyltransferase 1
VNACALYNEIDPFAAQWLDNLIAAGHVAPGRVERRSIADLTPADVAGPGQRHFFAGIGGWSYALRLAGVSDDADVWTGSCPCQPFSDAGKGLGVRDPRHLWPTWFELIRECRPPTIFGEQVASRDGLAWLDLVRSDLEGCGYAVGASDLCAAGVGAPHIRQRLYFLAHAGNQRREGQRLRVQPRRSRSRRPEIGGAARLALPHELGDSSSARSGRNAGAVSDAEASGPGSGRESRRVADEPGDAGASGMADAVFAGRPEGRPESRIGSLARGGRNGRVGNADDEREGEVDGVSRGPCAERSRGTGVMADTDIADAFDRDESRSGRQLQPEKDATHGFWRDCEWIACSDGVSRPVEPGTFPLAHGLPARVGRLRGYGNAIVPQVAAVFIEAAFAAVGDVK